MNQSICPKCHKAVSSDAKFCPNCGVPLSGDSATSASGRRNTVRDFAVIVGVLAVVVIAYFLFREKPAPAATSSAANAAPTEMPADAANPHRGMEGITAGMLDSLPKDYNSLVGLGNNYMDNGNFALAAECYRRALAIDGSSADVRTDYGACLHGMGLPNRAIEEFKKVLVQYPKHGIANFNLGIVYREMGENDSARLYWNKYLSLDPNGEVANAARKYLKELGG
jgi:tetratricopeptide (TPR) repeat protein